MITKSDVNAFYCLEDLTQFRNMTADYFYRVIEALEKLDDKSKNMMKRMPTLNTLKINLMNINQT